MADAANQENLSRKVAGKLGLLTFIEEETQGILNTKDCKAIGRQLNIYESKIEEVYELKTSAQELKLGDGEDMGEIQTGATKLREKSRNLTLSWRNCEKL